MADATTHAQGLVIERVFDASLERVWRAWSDPEQLKRWWGPKDFTAPSITLDFKEGGKYLFCMRGVAVPGGEPQDFWSTGTYKEIVPMSRIVWTDSFADPEGNIVPSSYYHMPVDLPLEMIVTIAFESLPDGKTKLTLVHEGMPAVPDTGAKEGWNQSLDKLAESLR